jgi:hypothetical protein
MRGCRRLFEGDEETPLLSASMATTKCEVLSISLPGPILPFGRAAGPGRKHHYIRFVVIQCAESAIANAAVANHAAILKFEVTDVCKLLLLCVSDYSKQE